MTATRTFTTVAVASRDDLVVHPDVLATVVVEEKARLVAEMSKAGYRRSGPWRQSVSWARPVGHRWVRVPRRLASARVVRITAVAVPK